SSTRPRRSFTTRPGSVPSWPRPRPRSSGASWTRKPTKRWSASSSTVSMAESGKRLSPPQLLGKPVEAVSSFEQSNGDGDGKGWTVTLELLELERIPDTTSLLGTYEATL